MLAARRIKRTSRKLPATRDAGAKRLLGAAIFNNPAPRPQPAQSRASPAGAIREEKTMNADTQTTESTATQPAGSNTSPGKPSKRTAAAKPRKAGKKSSAKLVRKAGDAKQPSKPTDGTPLKTLLAKLKLPADGRAARRKLRAANFQWHDKRTRWNLNASQLKQAEKILSE